MTDRMGQIRSVYFVGIGGVGMASIAEVLINLGYRVHGSDLRLSAATERLESLGAEIHEGHDAAHVRETDVVVVSSAVGSDNPEIIEAKRRRIEVVQRAQMLGELRLAAGVEDVHFGASVNMGPVA